MAVDCGKRKHPPDPTLRSVNGLIRVTCKGLNSGLKCGAVSVLETPASIYSTSEGPRQVFLKH